MGRILQFIANQKFIYIVIILVIISVGFFVRFYGLGSQMVTGDDIGVAWTINTANNGYSSQFIDDKIHNQSHPDFNTLQYRALRQLDDLGLLDQMVPIINTVARFIVIPNAWTYAPIQFIFTPIFLSWVHDYQSTIFFGRLPSFVFSMLGLIAMIFIFLRLDAQKYINPCIIGLLLMTLSWESIIYAKHMSCYSIGILAIILLLHILITLINNSSLTISRAVLSGLLLALIVNMQYQVIFFIPALYLTWLLSIWVGRKLSFISIKIFIRDRRFIIVVVSALSFLLFVLPSLLLFIIPQSRANNVEVSGIAPSYYFNPQLNSSFYENFYYIVSFFINNGLSTLRFITTFLPYDSVFAIPSFTILVLFFFSGVVSFFRSSHSIIKFLGFFLLFSALTIVCLVIFGKVALSPTRHAIVYLPLVVLVISLGFNEFFSVFSKFYKVDIYTPIVVLLTCLVITLFLFNFNSVIQKRESLINISSISRLMVEYRPQYVLVSTYSLWDQFLYADWKKGNIPRDVYINKYENLGNFDPGVFVLINPNDYLVKICGSENDWNLDLKKLCKSSSYDVLSQYSINSNASLDISDEAKPFFNYFNVLVLRVK